MTPLTQALVGIYGALLLQCVHWELVLLLLPSGFVQDWLWRLLLKEYAL